MAITARNPWLSVVAATIAAITSGGAFAEVFDLKEGHWRLELTGYQGLDQGSEDHSSDQGLTASIEYEVPLWSRLTVGFRLLPFYYDDSVADEDVFGLGIGPTLRLYQKKVEKRGLFGELAVAALGHINRFEDNSSNLNFISEVGLGYKTRRNWSVTVKWRHISNAGLGDDNSGVNGIGLGIGYTF